MSLLRLHDTAAALAWLKAKVQVAQGGRITTDSRRVRPGDGFIAWPGYATDGRQYVAQALAAGAAACLVEAEGVEAYDFRDERVAALPALKAATGEIASRWHDAPSQRLQVLAATGTNGKSSTAWWTAQALTLLGQRCGVVGTLGVGVPPTPAHPEGEITPTGLTTPDPITLQSTLADLLGRGFAACAIEASSIGIVEHRLAGTRIQVAQFTNFTRDHLDYHGSMQAYWQAKRELFSWPGLRAAVVNIDDDAGALLAGELVEETALDLWTTSVRGGARLAARELHYIDGGLAFTLVEGDAQVLARTALIGEFNVSNLLAVVGALRTMGHALTAIAAVLPQLTPVPGRMQRVAAGADEPEVVVDYAHTPDALEKALSALGPLAVARGGRLWCVFGCGGNRDATKRPLMGAIAAKGADRVIVTSDNPRHESPQAILDQIVAGVDRREPHEHVAVIESRRDAIVQAVRGADACDVVLVAGKGHEEYQDVAGVKQPFSDVAEAAAALSARRAA